MSPKYRAAVEPELLEEAAVALAVVVMSLTANGARLVAYLPWPVLHAGQPGRRYEATVAHHPIIAVPQGM